MIDIIISSGVIGLIVFLIYYHRKVFKDITESIEKNTGRGSNLHIEGPDKEYIMRVISLRMQRVSRKDILDKYLIGEHIVRDKNDGDKIIFIAEQYIKEIKAPYINECNKLIIYGLLWFLGGSLVTLIGYMAASKGGGFYIIAVGAIVYGFYDMARGIYYRIMG
ncbi:MAG: hypothetical protein AB1599_05800 [Planctomycetota bacterium]